MNLMIHIIGLLAVQCLAVSIASSQQDSAAVNEESWSVHFQQTIVTQYHPDFSAKYSGENSLRPTEPAQTSITSTFFIGRRLWDGAELYLNAELAGGDGLSSATGMAGFPNGETFRIGDPTPRIILARAFLKQTITLSDKHLQLDSGPNQLAGTMPSSRLSLALGKLSIADYFDKNQFSNDPRSQFLNWALINSGAWDYPADTRGYTWGMVVEYTLPLWAFKVSSALVPTEANKSHMDLNIHEAKSETVELKHSYQLEERAGGICLLAYYTQARMGNYQQALQAPPGDVDVVTTRAYGRTKYGFALNIEQQLSDYAGSFVRASWNDGTNETWMYTEIDRSLATGILVNGMLWERNGDSFGAALLANGISKDHRDYLSAGGYGFLIGDGALNFGSELISELFYSSSMIRQRLWLTGDYQFIVHPAYNRDRGPVHVLGLRAHVEF
jgi:high affinity Mn2+ porin